MEKFIGREMKPAIQSFQVKSAVSKDGNPYQYISLTLINGYEKKIFIQSAEQFAFNNAFELLSTQKSVDLQTNPATNTSGEAF